MPESRVDPDSGQELGSKEPEVSSIETSVAQTIAAAMPAAIAKTLLTIVSHVAAQINENKGQAESEEDGSIVETLQQHIDTFTSKRTDSGSDEDDDDEDCTFLYTLTDTGGKDY